MKHTGRIILIVGILVGYSLACQTAGEFLGGPTFAPTFSNGASPAQPTNTFVSQPTNPAAPEETPEPTPMVVTDDFSNSESGWIRISTHDGGADYSDGGYSIAVQRPNQMYWATSGHEFTNVRVQVDAAFSSGETDNNFGVICRYQNEGNFYAFVISSDGYFSIRKRMDGGPLQTIIGDKFQFSKHIQLGGQTNTLTAECAGNQLRMFVNGEKIAETTDGDLTNGDVGVVVGTFSASSTVIVFDNFFAGEIE
ncbi:MAG TPA: hypothetical protein VJ965_12315 [Anaerolineales bacterium]|nr:hypothetical protein [Anaerolineales bacterium]